MRIHIVNNIFESYRVEIDEDKSALNIYLDRDKKIDMEYEKPKIIIKGNIEKILELFSDCINKGYMSIESIDIKTIVENSFITDVHTANIFILHD